ncbi:MCE family protein [Nocardioides caeni]|uniref:MCE family protein n=1 Tax=Nocardioides caeni TaxID=574700 RepID=UPI0031E75DD3
MTRRPVRIVALVALVAVMGGAIWWVQSHRHETITVTATFPSTVGLYPGDDVRVVGVPMGTITEITPRGGSVDVEMELDADTPVAADTAAVIVPPGLLSSRYVQLTEPWLDGDRLADGDTIGIERTAAPLELDDVTAQLDGFLEALGPQGGNADGSLGRLVEAADTALAGNGATLRQTLADLADALDTVGTSRGDIVTTIEQLQTFVTSLAGSDDAIRGLERDLGSFTTTLAGQRDQLRTTIDSIATTVKAVNRFVRSTRGDLTANVRLLKRLSTTLVDRQRDLMEIADLGSPSIQAIFGAANLTTGVLDARVNLTPLLTYAGTTLCEILEGAALSVLCPSDVPPPPTGEDH